MKKKGAYTLTTSAESDLRALQARSLELFGPIQTNRFIARLKKAAEFASTHIGKLSTRSHLVGDSGLSLYPVSNQFLVYRPVSDHHIVILAIVTQSRDIPALIAAKETTFQETFRVIEQSIKRGKITFHHTDPSAKKKRKK